jgi:hypothetical protein
VFKYKWELQNLPNLTPLYFLIFFKHYTFCIIVFKGTFFQQLFCSVKVSYEYIKWNLWNQNINYFKFFFFTMNNSKQIQNVFRGICWYIFKHFSLSESKHNRDLPGYVWLLDLKAFIFVSWLRVTYWGVADKQPKGFSNYCTELIL